MLSALATVALLAATVAFFAVQGRPARGRGGTAGQGPVGARDLTGSLALAVARGVLAFTDLHDRRRARLAGGSAPTWPA